MKKYRINYIDGHDLRYKSFETAAENEKDALSNLWAQYKDGDFDHQIVEIIEINGAAESKFRISGSMPAPVPFLKKYQQGDCNKLQ